MYRYETSVNLNDCKVSYKNIANLLFGNRLQYISELISKGCLFCELLNTGRTIEKSSSLDSFLSIDLRNAVARIDSIDVSLDYNGAYMTIRWDTINTISKDLDDMIEKAHNENRIVFTPRSLGKSLIAIDMKILPEKE